MNKKEMLEFVEKAYKEGNMPVWDYEKFKEEFREISAEETFKNLGYDMYTHNYSIEYVNWEKDNYIWFYFENKSVEVPEQDIDMKTLQAINKQVSELGWLDD